MIELEDLYRPIVPLLLTTNVEASITAHCKNGGGNEPQGNCNGNGLKTVNENPAGSAPPGQNK
jgi:hypothetical protein